MGYYENTEERLPFYMWGIREDYGVDTCFMSSRLSQFVTPATGN